MFRILIRQVACWPALMTRRPRIRAPSFGVAQGVDATSGFGAGATAAPLPVSWTTWPIASAAPAGWLAGGPVGGEGDGGTAATGDAGVAEVGWAGGVGEACGTLTVGTGAGFGSTVGTHPTGVTSPGVSVAAGTGEGPLVEGKTMVSGPAGVVPASGVVPGGHCCGSRSFGRTSSRPTPRPALP